MKKRALKLKKVAVNKSEKKITRKDAIKKAGYITLSAAAMMLLISNPSQAQPQSSPATKPQW